MEREQPAAGEVRDRVRQVQTVEDGRHDTRGEECFTNVAEREATLELAGVLRGRACWLGRATCSTLEEPSNLE